MNRITLASLFAATLFAVSLAAAPSMAQTAGVAGPGQGGGVGGDAAASAGPGVGTGSGGESGDVFRARPGIESPNAVARRIVRPRPVRVRNRQVPPTPECLAGQRVELDVVSFRYVECHAAPR